MLTLVANPIMLADIRDKLRMVGLKAGRKTVRDAARKAMIPVRDRVKATAPFDPTPDGKHIRSNVSLQTKWRGNTLIARVGIRGGAKANPDTPWYFRLQEFGTRHQPARPFMRPALEQDMQQIINTVAGELTRALFS